MKLNDSKYGDDSRFEAFADRHFFFRIASFLTDPLRNIGFTPNGITYVSTTFTFIVILLLYFDYPFLAVISLLLGYIFDCIDGKMARRYNMRSDVGMALDVVTDAVANTSLQVFLIFKYAESLNIIFFVIFTAVLTVVLQLNFSMLEALGSYESGKSLNFYDERHKRFTNKRGIGFVERMLYKYYLAIMNNALKLFNIFYANQPIEKTYKSLRIMKEFGSGHYALIMSIAILVLHFL